MSPIVSPYDTRLLTLAGVVINLAEELAVWNNQSPREGVAEALFLVSKRVHEHGEEDYMDRLCTDYPILQEAIT